MQYDISAVCIPAAGRKREEYDEELTKVLEQHHVDLILLIGWMRVLSAPFVQRWRNMYVDAMIIVGVIMQNHSRPEADVVLYLL